MNFKKTFLEKSYVIGSVANEAALSEIRSTITTSISQSLGIKIKSLKDLHNYLTFDDVNIVRMKAYNDLNALSDVMEKYFSIFQPTIEGLVGSELASQNNINLNIQLPHDKTSRLGLHTDTVSGQSEFEVVAWLPLTDAFSSNAMFAFNFQDSQRMLSELPNYQTKGMDELYNDWASKSFRVELAYGQKLVFSSTLMHGNTINETNQTRVSLNTRFKSLFSPYNNLAHSEKKLGNFYRPFRVSPVTELALRYEEPNGQF